MPGQLNMEPRCITTWIGIVGGYWEYPTATRPASKRSSTNMNWLRHDSDISEGDMKTFFFQDHGTSRILSLSKRSGFSTRQRFWNLSGESEWKSWLNAGHLRDDNDADSTLNILFCGRVEKSYPDPLIVARLPFPKHIFDQVRAEFRVHGSVARVINRNTRCTFMHMPYQYSQDSNENAIVYNCRTVATWPRDMAVSVSFAPKTLTTYAVVYGCDKEATDLFTAKLTSTDHSVFHPMFLPTLLADMERERQVGRLRKNSAKMGQLTVDLTINKGLEEPDEVSQLNQTKELIELWQDMSYLKNGLQNWQRQLQKMAIHLEESFNTMIRDSTRYDVEVQESLTVPGIRIQKRLEELVDEYDEHIRDCATVTEGLNLAMSMDTRTTNQEIAHSSLEVSTLAQKDGSLMKLIAFVTMFFLPATFTSTFFSMDFFDWPKAADAFATGYIWVYFVVAGVLTVITVGWFSTLIFGRKKYGKDKKGSMV